jgi:hypothetical protein
MSHVMMVFLVEAENFDDAQSKVYNYIEDIHDWWDYGEVVDKSEKFNRPLSECIADIPHPDFMPIAETALKEAEEYNAKKDYRWAGYKYRMAGILFEQLMSYDYPMWNMTIEDYSIPEDPTGWFAIEADLHY